MDIRSERLLVLKHNPCSDHVRAPLTPPMTIVRIKYSSVYREINISPHKNINSAKPLSSTWRRTIVEFIKLDFGNVVMVTGGRNRGRVGVIRNPVKLKGSFETTTTYKTQQDMSLQQG
ncbi:unnamed protein product [Brassica rapa]|uniref:KOW domain-containing protein n=2 Tax=Brassica TaxID=3705 RepID=A0A3P6AKV6_BRACM|nr:unnamed protein product [Brassica napus]CAG7895530.1 unnamed protein product [Brassica rapa]CDY68858.1 BnaAnng28590D [Brassica napus]VDC92117.1 unnamed protein product [Brassica rapa]